MVKPKPSPFVRHGIHLKRPGAERTLCDNLAAILLPDLKGECSICKAAAEKEIGGA